jgi:hypothetical protein
MNAELFTCMLQESARRATISGSIMADQSKTLVLISRCISPPQRTTTNWLAIAIEQKPMRIRLVLD